MPLNTLYLGDCLELFPNVPTGGVNMILADLPYVATRNSWDVLIEPAPLFAQYRRVLAPGGVIALTATQPFASLLIAAAPRAYRYSWIWDKVTGRGHLNARRRPLQQHEEILIFSFDAPRYFPQMIKGAFKNKNSGKANNSPNYGKQVAVAASNDLYYPKSILRFSDTVNKGKIHPTQKPVPLFEYLIKTYTQPGEVVLDNCMGSGTTAIAAINTGRNWCGMEKTPAIFQAATERINAHLSAQQND